MERALDDREKIRQDINESRIRADKFLRDQVVDDNRFKVQVWTAFCTAAGVVVAAFAAGAAWVKFIS